MRLSDIKGLKEKRLLALEGEGITTPYDLAYFFPVKYLDMTTLSTVADFEDGKEALIKGIVINTPSTFRFSKVQTTKTVVEVDGKRINAMWFNQPYIGKNLIRDETYFFYGKIKIKDKSITILSPMFERKENAKRLFGIVTKYKKIENVPSTLISDCVKTTLENISFDSVINDELQEKYKLLNINQALYYAHFPKTINEGIRGLDRVFIENTIKMMLSYKFIPKGKKERKYLDFDPIKALNNVLPFTLSASQEKAIDEMVKELKSNQCMNRMLQGDVGSGKTLVAVALSLFNAKSGYQTVLLSPTVTLAMQHYNTFCKILKELGVRVGINTNTVMSEDIVEKAKNGEVDVIIGTHSLLSESVTFSNLTLAIIDEQQKFGVNERGILTTKGENIDVLSMTATPIPRTLSLLVAGELSVSYLENRKEKRITTYVISKNKVTDCYKFIDDKISCGGRAYIVCPKIFDDEKTEKEGATTVYKEVKDFFKTRKVGLLHGKLSKIERDKVTKDFIDNKLDILVSTSVIEVGIDNQDANTIVIFEAENFGLSSLHQLRGRIGRRGQESYCFLVNNNVNEKQKERLTFFKENLDGYKIADFDLATRGCGDIFGTNQHGTGIINQMIGFSYENIKIAKKIYDEIDIDNLDRAVVSEIENGEYSKYLIPMN